MDLEKINQLLAGGLSISKVEKELGFGKDTLRKKLNRHGYHFDKDLRQYVADTETTPSVEKPAKPVAVPAPIKKNPEPVAQVSTPSYTAPFTEQQVDVLHRMIREFQAREQIQATTSRGTVKNRNVRVYTEQFDVFADWCKQNNITQADALFKAIEALMNSF